MTYTDRYRHLTAQRAYMRAARRGGIPALLRPYSVRPVSIPLQRRRLVRSEVAA